MNTFQESTFQMPSIHINQFRHVAHRSSSYEYSSHQPSNNQQNIYTPFRCVKCKSSQQLAKNLTATNIQVFTANWCLVEKPKCHQIAKDRNDIYIYIADDCNNIQLFTVNIVKPTPSMKPSQIRKSCTTITAFYRWVCFRWPEPRWVIPNSRSETNLKKPEPLQSMKTQSVTTQLTKK